jgi:hypothetical protein
MVVVIPIRCCEQVSDPTADVSQTSKKVQHTILPVCENGSQRNIEKDFPQPESRESWGWLDEQIVESLGAELLLGIGCLPAHGPPNLLDLRIYCKFK